MGLPPGWNFYCSAAKTYYDGRSSAGLAVWNPNGESFVAIDPATGNYEGVGAHESCHSQQFIMYGQSSEADADACAAAHGYPNPYARTGDTGPPDFLIIRSPGSVGLE